MRVVWEASALLPPRTGVGRSGFELLRALTEISGDALECHLVWRSLRRSLPATDRAALRGAVVHAGRFPPGPLLHVLWQRLGAPPIERLAGLDSLDLAHGVAAFLPPTRARVRVLTVHDLHFLRQPQHAHALGGRLLARHLPHAVKRATRLITPSQATARDCEELLGVARDRIAVIPHGGVEEFGAEPDAATWERFERQSGQLPDRFWLAIATLEPRKNLGVLLDALGMLRERDEDLARLIHAGGSGWGSLGLENRLAGLAALGVVQCVGQVESWWLRCALRRAEALIMPSLAEGFGLPLIEAMASGCPVICSDIPVFHEVTGGHARFFDPRNAESLASEMTAAAADPSGQRGRAARAREFVAPFTWERAARRTLEIYGEALA